MAKSFVRLNNDGTGKQMDTNTLATSGDHRPSYVIGDPSVDAAVAAVVAVIQGYGLVTSTADVPAATGNITAVDIASTTNPGQGGQSIVTGAPTAGSAIMQSFSGNSSVSIQISGSFVGTLVFERSLDGGTTWTPIGMFAAGTQNTSSTATLPGSFHGNASACTNVRVRCTSFTSGPIAVRILSGEGVGTVTLGSAMRAINPSGAGIPVLADASGNQTIYEVSMNDALNDSISAYIKAANYTRLTATGVVSSTPCVYYGYTVEASSAGTLVVNQNTAASGDTIGGSTAVSLTANTIQIFQVPILCPIGLYATIAGTATINFLTRPVSK